MALRKCQDFNADRTICRLGEEGFYGYYEKMKESQKEKSAKSKATAARIVSSILSDGRIVELVYDPQRQETSLCLYQAGAATLHRSIRLDSGGLLLPVPATNNLIKHGALLLSERPAPYGSIAILVASIRRYITRYVDLSEAFLGIATYYVLLTWVYDAFNELPYLRLRGDYGCGKTRALLVIGSICYKPFFASGASTVSPIFHTIDTFRGTLLFDEADFRFSDERAELIKVFNNGNVRGFPVLRTAMTPQKEFNPQAFAVFGPKLVAMRDAFQDPALESRFITEEMGQRTMRQDIPINLPDKQKEEALELRNQLLMYRFDAIGSAAVDSQLADRDLSPRLNQILVPLLSIIDDEAVRNDIRRAARSLDAQLRAERSAMPEAQLLEVLEQAFASTTDERVWVADVTRCFAERFGADYERPITNRYVGSLLRKRLRIATYKSHGTYAVARTEREKLRVIAKRYGLEMSA